VLNKVMEKPVSQKPEHGRVVGAGGGCKWDYYYHEDTATRKERKRLEQLDVREELATVKANMPQLVQDEVAKTITALLPTMMQSISTWIEGGRQGPFPMPSLGASNSTNGAPDINAPIMENPAANNAPGMENSPAVTMPCSSPSISCTPVRGASTLAELDAIMIIKRRRLNKLFHPCPL
jgi:hypothetical protein